MRKLALAYICEIIKIWIIGFIVSYVWMAVKVIVIGNDVTNIEDIILNCLATYFIYFKLNKRNILNLHNNYDE